MRPIKLIMSAFGSYGGVECIEFDKLHDGLFLITGDTGAGKTTIFDGISYALYGQTSGRRRDGDMMRSQYAKDTDETYVEFHFNEAGKIYKIRRNPNWFRRSRRKNKYGEYALTKVAAKVELIMPDETQFPGKMKETDQKIIEIIGMDMDQFSQVSMISQGDFMKLLLATSKERKEIFSRIFPTQIYWRVQAKLKEQERQLSGQLENIRIRCVQDIENISCRPENSYWKIWQEKGKFSNIDNEEMLCILSAMNEEDLKKEKLLEKSIERLEKGIEAGRKLEEKRNNIDGILREIKDLECKIDEDRERILEKEKSFEDLQKSCDIRGKKKQNELVLLQHEMSSYDQLEEEKEKYDNLCRSSKKLELSIKQLEAEKCQKEQEQANLRSEQEKLKDSAVEVLKAGQDVTRYREMVSRAQSLLDKKPEWRKLQKKEKDAALKVEQSLKIYREASSYYDHIYEQFIASQAGLMAKDLKEGMSCPVCGSLHHPNLKLPGSDEAIVDRETVETAKKNREQAEKDVNEIQHMLSKISEKSIQLRSRISAEAFEWMEDAGKTNPDDNFWNNIEERSSEIKNLSINAEKKWNRLKADQHQFEKNGVRLKELEEDLQNIQSVYTLQLQKRMEISAMKKSQEQSLDKLQKNLTYTSKEEAKGHEELLKKELDDMKAGIEREENKLREERKNLQFKKGQLTERKEQQISEENLKGEFQSVYEAFLEEGGWPDTTSVERLETVKVSYQREEKKIYSLHQSNKRIYTHLKSMLHIYNEQQALFKVVSQLSRTANGELTGTAKIDFQTYMQRRYFKEMVKAANVRLANMSGQQFLLECRDIENLGKRGESGLDLDVYSLVNDQIRDVKTLSGGESFMAALSLALGMADVIQREAGKIHVDTLFIDEGFGSLDENARNHAVRVLNELTGDVCLVGIISHVSELKEQIEQKIQVKKTERGSKIETCHSL